MEAYSRHLCERNLVGRLSKHNLMVTHVSLEEALVDIWTAYASLQKPPEGAVIALYQGRAVETRWSWYSFCLGGLARRSRRTRSRSIS